MFLEFDEVISETPINRLNKTATPALTEAAPQITTNSEIKNVVINEIKIENGAQFVTNNFKSMSQGEALAMLAKKQQNDQVNPEVSLVPIAKIVEQVKKTVEKINDLKSLEKAVREFEGCALKKMATNTVFSDGDPHSKIMIIGEAPGNNEDLQGIPFCGDSGKLLDEMFAAIGYPREKVYITNTLFWRPPGNRRPTDDELAMCKPFVEKHIELMNPKIIVLMGSTAMFGILGINEPISKIRGKFLDYSNPYLSNPIKTISLFHPSYLMRQSSKKRLAWEDMLTIKHFLQK